jgi:aquaporin Z
MSNRQRLSSVMTRNWPEYLIEGWALGMFMISAGVFTTLFEYPGSPLHSAIGNADLRRVLIGVAMGLTAIGLIYSPWGQRSGAHMNPAVTLTFWRLGKIATWDAVFYIVAQCLGGTLGVLLTAILMQHAFTAPPVAYVVTVPGSAGVIVAFIAEAIISVLMMSVILRVANSRYAKFTGLCAGLLVATYISIEAPLSGMSINPARSLASAWPSGIWTDFWIYLSAPVLGMQIAAWLHTRGRQREVACAKLQHPDDQRCIHCNYLPMAATNMREMI